MVHPENAARPNNLFIRMRGNLFFGVVLSDLFEKSLFKRSNYKLYPCGLIF